MHGMHVAGAGAVLPMRSTLRLLSCGSWRMPQFVIINLLT